MNFSQIFECLGTKLEQIPILNKFGFRGKKLGIIASAAVLAIIIILILVIVLCSGGGYTSIISDYEKLANYKVTDMEDYLIISTGGICKGEIGDIFDVLEKSDDFQDTISHYKENMEDALEDAKDKYGDNFKIKVKLEEKEDMENADLRKYRDNIHDLGERLVDFTDKFKDYDSDEWEDFAEKKGLSKSEAKKLIGYSKDLGKQLKGLTVSEGYELECVTVTSGSELDEPDESDFTFDAIKIDGKWVDANTLLGQLSILTSYIY